MATLAHVTILIFKIMCLLLLAPEPLVLEVEGEVALGAEPGMGNVVAFHSFPSCDLTNFCHNYLIFIVFLERGANIALISWISKLLPTEI